jgi:putative transposase
VLTNVKCITKKTFFVVQNSAPYENAIAERINGILKEEFMIDKYEQNLETMKVIVKETVEIYNQNRLYFSNYLLTPNQMHQQNKLKIRTYKTKNSSNKSATTV